MSRNLSYEEMEEIIKSVNFILIEGDVTMTSLEIAKVTGKEHYQVLRDIRHEMNSLHPDALKDIHGKPKFEEINVPDSYGRLQPAILLNSEGILQIMSRYDANIRALIVRQVMTLKEIATMGGKRQLSNVDELTDIHSILRPLVYHIYEIYNNLSNDSSLNLPEEAKEYFLTCRKEYYRRTHHRSEFYEWWELLQNHQRDTGIYDRELKRPIKD